MADTQLVLGDITFRDFEIPEKINFGGRQTLVTQKLIGGRRVVDAMGPDADDIKWHGRFRGEDAVDRARQLDTLRAIGSELPLTWGGFFYFVAISHFEADYERFYEVPYHIVCHVVTDPENDAAAFTLSSLSSIIGGDLDSLIELSGLL